MWPIVPMLTCGLLRSNFFLATRPFHSLIRCGASRCIDVGRQVGDPGDGAHNRTRTDDLFLTKEVLCQLSYVGQVAAASGDRLVGREGFEPPCLSDLVYSQASRRCSTDPV